MSKTIPAARFETGTFKTDAHFQYDALLMHSDADENGPGPNYVSFAYGAECGDVTSFALRNGDNCTDVLYTVADARAFAQHILDTTAGFVK